MLEVYLHCRACQVNRFCWAAAERGRFSERRRRDRRYAFFPRVLPSVRPLFSPYSPFTITRNHVVVLRCSAAETSIAQQEHVVAELLRRATPRYSLTAVRSRRPPNERALARCQPRSRRRCGRPGAPRGRRCAARRSWARARGRAAGPCYAAARKLRHPRRAAAAACARPARS